MRSLVSVVVAAALLAVSFGITALVMKGIDRLRTEPEATVATLLEAPVNDFSVRTNRQRNGFTLPDGTALSADFFLHALKLGDTWSGSGTGAFVTPGQGDVVIPVTATTLSKEGVARWLRMPLGTCEPGESFDLFGSDDKRGVSLSFETESASLSIELFRKGEKWNIVALKSFSPGAPIGRGSTHIGSIRYVCNGGVVFAGELGDALTALF